MCQNDQCRSYMSYLVVMVALLGSSVYSGYALSKEHSLLLDHDCKELPWANVAVTATSLLLAVSILTLLCCESMGCKRSLGITSIVAYAITNVWAFTTFWIMGHDCQKYYRKNYETFWYMNLVQYIVLGVILVIMALNIIVNCWSNCCRTNRVGINYSA